MYKHELEDISDTNTDAGTNKLEPAHEVTAHQAQGYRDYGDFDCNEENMANR